MSNESFITERPFEATNDKPYIFISYKHDDWREVYPIIDRLHDAGYNIWYDAGLTKGKNYDIEIANYIKNSKLFITFMTKRVMAKANDQEDYIIKEMLAAIRTKRDRLVIYLDSLGPDDLDGFYLMNCAGIQSIYKHHYGNNEDMFIDECLDTLKHHFLIEPNKSDSNSNDELKRVGQDSKAIEEYESNTTTSDSQKSIESIKASFPPYEGDNPYLYVAYDSTDVEEVFPEIEKLHDLGYDICYNHNPALQIIEKAITGSKAFVVFISENSIKSHNVREEIFMAVDNNVPIVTIHLDSTKINRSLQSILDSQTSISKYSLSQDEFICTCIYHFAEKGIILPQNNFRYLDFLIHKGNKNVVLKSDIIFDDDDVGYEGIVVDVDKIVIDGNGHSIDAKSRSRIFTVTGNDVNFKSLTIKNGYSTQNYGNSDDIEWRGGAIYNTGSCTFNHCNFMNNVVGKKTHSPKYFYAFGGAIYNIGDCNLINSSFEANQAIAQDHTDGKDIYGTESCNIINCTFEGEVKTQIRKIDIFGIEYSFRNPNSDIYKLAENIFHVSNKNESDEFSELSDERYSIYELDAIRAMCIANAAGAVISPKDNCEQSFSSEKLKNFQTIDRARELFVSKMKKLGWQNGKYDFENRTCALFTGGCLGGDQEERHYQRVVDHVLKRFSFCKLEDGDIDIPVLQLTEKLADQKQISKSESDLYVKDIDLPESYEGSEPYIFVSYKHSDSKIVFPVIKQLIDAGFNVCYDKGIVIGADYDIQIANLIKNSSLFITMVTENLINSSMDENDYAVKELSAAISLKIPCLPICLENVDLNGYYRIHYLNKQPIFKFELNDDEFIESCISAFKDFGLEANNQKSSTDFKSAKAGSESEDLVKPVENPPKAYAGNEPYMYVSYSHMDANRVFPEIRRFQDKGYNVWYDEGVGPGNEWLEDILDHLIDADLFIVFITNNAVSSRNVRKEIRFAINKGKNILPIYLEDFDEIDMDIQLDYELSSIKNILKTTLDEEEYDFRCVDAFKNFGLKPDDNKSISDTFNDDTKPEAESEKKGLRSRLFGRK